MIVASKDIDGEYWRGVGLMLAGVLGEDWINRIPEGMIFKLSMPTDPREGNLDLRIHRVPESDAEAIGMVHDRWDELMAKVATEFDDRTIEFAKRPRKPRAKKVDSL